MAKYRIRTFRGYSYKSTYETALQEAKDMILDIIVDKHRTDLWWAEIRRVDDGEFVAMVTCPQIGKWTIKKAFIDMQDYCGR